jgi:hypothetical protein
MESHNYEKSTSVGIGNGTVFSVPLRYEKKKNTANTSNFKIFKIK